MRGARFQSSRVQSRVHSLPGPVSVQMGIGIARARTGPLTQGTPASTAGKRNGRRQQVGREGAAQWGHDSTTTRQHDSDADNRLPCGQALSWLGHDGVTCMSGVVRPPPLLVGSQTVLCPLCLGPTVAYVTYVSSPVQESAHEAPSRLAIPVEGGGRYP